MYWGGRNGEKEQESYTYHLDMLVKKKYRSSLKRNMEKKRKKKGEDIEGCRKVCDECETCIKFRRNPDKPVVGFALGKVFNKVVRVDVEELEGEKFLVMINLMINEVGCKSKELFQFEYEGWVLTKPTSVWEKSHSAYLIGRGKPSCFEMGERKNT